MGVNFINSLSVNGNYADIQMGENKEVQEIAAVFSALMNEQQDFVTSMVEPGSFDNKVGAVKSSNAISDSYERYNYKENHINEAKEMDFAEKFEEVSDELQEFEQKALDAVSEEFGVEKEEIMAVLEEMGLSVMDLLNPQNLVSFVMELTGLTAKEELLLNDNFLSIMSSMDTMKKELMTELNVTPEDLEKLVDLMQQVTPEEVTFAEQLTGKMEQEVEGVEEILNQGNINEETEYIETTESEEPVIQTEVVNEENAQSEGLFERNASDKSKNDQFTENNQSNDPFMTTTSNVNSVQTADSSQMSSYLNTNTMEIIKQIVEQVKVSITTETKTMEMQLNPEHLGRIHVSISEENGVIHAQFTATNELVKEALEAQLATLRENLNQAGVKVDAIEVTVEAHQFESNLEQNHKREENEGAYKEELAQKRRNLNVNSLDELSGLMTEEEALVAQIMKDNGNSVDLTA